jgi:hypothetical protein
VFTSEAGQRLLVGALVLTMPSGRYREGHVPVVLEMAARLSAALGA